MITPTEYDRISTVVAVNETHVRTYNPELGYIEWEIVEKKGERVLEGDLQAGEYLVKTDYGRGYILITPGWVLQYSTFTIDETTFTFHAKFKRKPYRGRY